MPVKNKQQPATSRIIQPVRIATRILDVESNSVLIGFGFHLTTVQEAASERIEAPKI